MVSVRAATLGRRGRGVVHDTIALSRAAQRLGRRTFGAGSAPRHHDAFLAVHLYELGATRRGPRDHSICQSVGLGSWVYM